MGCNAWVFTVYNFITDHHLKLICSEEATICVSTIVLLLSLPAKSVVSHKCILSHAKNEVNSTDFTSDSHLMVSSFTVMVV